MPPRLLTDRLELISLTAVLARAAVDDRDELSRLLDAAVPDEWPPEIMRDVMEFFAERLEQEPELEEGWWAWYIVHREDRVLIGSAGFAGAPDFEGKVVMGYSIIPSYEGKGYTTEAARALVDWAFEHPEVNQVVADTFPDHAASIRVMEKCGMTYVGEGDDVGTVRYGISRANRL